MLATTIHGIKYHPEFVDETFAKLIASPENLPDFAAVSAEDLVPPETTADPDALFDAVWARVNASPEFTGRANELEAHKAEAKARALGPVTLPPDADAALGAALAVPYRVVVAPDGTSNHILGGVEVLQIPGTFGNAKQANARAKVIISAAKVAIDVLMIVACACGVQAVLMQRAAARAVASTAAAQGPALLAASAKMAAAQAAKTADNVKKLQAVLAVVFKGLDVWKMAWMIVSEMTWLEQGLAVATVLVNLGLAFASAGASLWLRIAALGVAIASFVNDLVTLVKNVQAARAA